MQALDLLARILDPSIEMKSKVCRHFLLLFCIPVLALGLTECCYVFQLYDGPVNGSKKGLESSHANMALSLKDSEMPTGRADNRYSFFLSCFFF